MFYVLCNDLLQRKQRSSMNSIVEIEEYEAWIILHRIADLITRYETLIFSNAQVTAQQFWVLMTIAFLEDQHKDPITISDLVTQHDRNLASISSMIDRIEQKGLIEKKIRDLPDRRSIRIIITEKGYKVLKLASKNRIKLINDLFGSFSKHEIKKTSDQNKKIRDRLEELTSVSIEERNYKPDASLVTQFLNTLNS
jgi:DNA-binding MarR family transcriptional regulator